MNEKKYIFHIAIIFIVIAAALFFGAYQLGRANQRADGRAGDYTTAARELNQELGDEQRGTLRRITDSIERLEKIRGISEETNRNIKSLRGLDRRASGIYQEITEELDILENYFRSVSDIIDDVYDL